MEPIRAALIGAGGRGKGTFGGFAMRYPHALKFVAVAEPDPERRLSFMKVHDISAEQGYSTWEDLLNGQHTYEAVIIATMDRLHYLPAMRALELGYHVLLEKPMSPIADECVRLAQQARQVKRLLMICHELRYTPFFSAVKKVLDEGCIGRIVHIQHNENVGYFHQAHSFVRGNWRNSVASSPMILAKSCHDMDILAWLSGSRCQKVSSFGSLTHFTETNAPVGSTLRCTDGCDVERQCPYSAIRIYLEEHTDWADIIANSGWGQDAVMRALQEGPYGRCVFHCDNDVVDHQVVNLEFAGGITAAFSMCAFSPEICRTLKIMGTDGELRGHMEKNEIEVTQFSSGLHWKIETPSGASHSGGDDGLLHDFVASVRSGSGGVLTSAEISVESHLMAFAAETSRLEHRVIDLQEFARIFE